MFTDGLILGLLVGALVMCVMALIAIRLTAPNYTRTREPRARNRAGGAHEDYTPNRHKLLW